MYHLVRLDKYARRSTLMGCLVAKRQPSAGQAGMPCCSQHRLCHLDTLEVAMCCTARTLKTLGRTS